MYYILDDVRYFTLDEASKATGIDKRTLENHVNGEWSSKKGVKHSLTEVLEEPCDPEVPATEAPSDCDTFRVATAEEVVKVADPSEVLKMPCLHRRPGHGSGHNKHVGNPLYKSY